MPYGLLCVFQDEWRQFYLCPKFPEQGAFIGEASHSTEQCKWFPWNSIWFLNTAPGYVLQR